MEKKIQDKELGTITLRYNSQATRYILKVKNGEIIAVLPSGGEESALLRFIEQNRKKLLEQISRRPKQLFDESTHLTTFSFSLRIFRSDRTNFYLSLKDGVLQIACPQHTDFTKASTQNILNSFIQKALRYEAKRILPPRLTELATQYGFEPKGVKIQSSKGRWGSCSSGKTINLSYHLMLLPGHLIDYVLLHELCHTREMNHGENFWLLMNRVTNGKAVALRRELRKYHPLH